jgi:cytochrome c553
MKRLALEMAALVTLLAVGGFLAAAAGVIPIAASEGHWAITQWFLQFTKNRSVATHSMWRDDRVASERWAVVKGAGHFHVGCMPCHGAHGSGYFPILTRGMLPPPPPLEERVAEWEPEELVYIVKHGIKFTGMPGWLAQQRDDEVRAVVAFLLELPRLDAEAYRQLVNEPAAPQPLPEIADVPRHVVVACVRCHGADGLGRGVGAFPKLAGQRREYLAAALQAFGEAERHSGIMQPMAAGLQPAQIAALADYFAALPPGGAAETNDEAAVARGRRIALDGIPNRRVPACADCHGPGATRSRANYPRLAGQYAEYLMLQLRLFKADHRGGSPYAHLMQEVAPRLSEADIRDVASYYASLAPEAPR